MVAAKDIVAGDSRSWRLSRQRLLHMGEAPANPDIEAFLRTSEGKLEKLKVDSDENIVVVDLDAETSEKIPSGTTFLIVRLTAESFYRRTMVLESFQVFRKVDDADFDHRTEAERCLAQAEKALADFSNGHATYKSYTIGTRSITVTSASELIELVDYWRNRVYLEKCAAQGVDPRKMLVEFV